MSIIVAIISSRDAVVASDGREFASATFCSGKLLKKAVVKREDFDKTFFARGKKAIGAFSGLTRFGGKAMGEHVREILDGETPGAESVEQIVESLRIRLAERMVAIDSCEVLFEHRNVHLLLAGGGELTRNHFQLASLNFSPIDAQIQCKSELYRHDKKGVLFSSARGDRLARRAAFGYIHAHTGAYQNRDTMESLAKKAIEEGIRRCGPHRYGDAPSCGGSIFFRKTWY